LDLIGGIEMGAATVRLNVFGVGRLVLAPLLPSLLDIQQLTCDPQLDHVDLSVIQNVQSKTLYFDLVMYILSVGPMVL
jgi:hypothetical protein